MTNSETKLICQALFIAYPNQAIKLDQSKFIGLWHKQLKDYSFSSVSRAIKNWIGEKKFIPQIAEIKDLINPWYDHFPQPGIIEYNDKDVRWAKWEDWKILPDELSKRMVFVPDNEDPERKKLLEKCEALKNKLLLQKDEEVK